MEELWAGNPPASARKVLTVYVSQLRKALGGADGQEVIVTRPPGYVLELPPEQLDLNRFLVLVEEARTERDVSAAAAVEKLREALALWRGPALAEFAYDSFARPDLERLEELRLSVVEERIDTELALGLHAQIVGELQALAAENPQRERLHGQLMLALYRSGRQAEALKVYGQLRHALVEDLGIEPSAAMKQLERDVLAQDPALDVHPSLVARTNGAAADKVAPPPSTRERKTVTVLVCNLSDVVLGPDEHDPEDVEELIERYQHLARSALERFGATVERPVGDAFVGVFGAPHTHEDDPERAIRAALDIAGAIDQLNADQTDLELQLSIGIDTGEALVSLGAGAESTDALAAGPVFKRAALIQAAAPTQGIAVSPETHRRTERIFAYVQLEPAHLSGRVGPLQLYRPLCAHAPFGGIRVSGPDTPFVGRQLELALLRALFERCAREGALQLVTLIGEPGVGKTRLITELLHELAALPTPVPALHSRCLPYGDGVPFWTLGELVKSYAGIYDTDTPQSAEEKLMTVLPEGEQRSWLIARLLPLLGIDPGTPAPREESFAAWRSFLESTAAESPTVVIVEDLHWADTALREFLTYLAEWSEGVPLLLICTARPEFHEEQPGWGASQPNATTMRLTPLSMTEATQLVSTLVETINVAPEVERAILQRAEGNPLYAEELVRLITDRRSDGNIVTEEEVMFPEGVQALIAARLDLLSPQRKDLVHDAAVLGKVFWAGAVAAMQEQDESELGLALHELTRRELVRPMRGSSMEREVEYQFWHDLVRAVAYGQIPRAAKARRHKAAAVWLEAKAGERIDEMAEVLSHHYLTALNLARAAGKTDEANELVCPARRFLTLAGERALGLDAALAETRLTQALELAPPDSSERAALLMSWADAADQAGRPREARRVLEETLRTFRRDGDVEAIGSALILLSRISSRLVDGDQIELAAEAASLLEQRPGTALVDAYARLAIGYFLTGALPEAVEAGDRAVAIAVKLGLPEPARALAFRGNARFFLGDVCGLAEMDGALELLLDSGAGEAAAQVMNNIAFARAMVVGPAESLLAYEQAVEFARSRGFGNVVGIRCNCVFHLAAAGRPEEALGLADELAGALESMGDRDGLIDLQAEAIGIRVARGIPGVLADAERLAEAARETNMPEIVTGALVSVASAAVVEGEIGRARAALTELEHIPGVRNWPNYWNHLPAITRAAVATGDLTLAKKLNDALEPVHPLHVLALGASEAAVAEAAGDHPLAASLYQQAAEGWRRWGNVPEQAFALLGAGRAMSGHDGDSRRFLSEASSLFSSLGYAPALAEIDALLEQTETSAH
jgi:DNA-binding SARP family transcriptional activator/tetratricopeptide (TPR) repeat protein